MKHVINKSGCLVLFNDNVVWSTFFKRFTGHFLGYEFFYLAFRVIYCIIEEMPDQIAAVMTFYISSSDVFDLLLP